MLKNGEVCSECGHCCSHSSGLVLESDIPKMASFLKLKTEEFKGKYLEENEIFHTKVFKIKSKKINDKPYGNCSFLKDKRCVVHPVKPLHCKICNCEQGEEMHIWFLVNYCLNIYDPESVRQYNSYIQTGGKVISGAELKELIPDKELLKKILNYEKFR